MTRPSAILVAVFFLLTAAPAVAEDDPEPDSEVTEAGSDDEEDADTDESTDDGPPVMHFDSGDRFGEPRASFPGEQLGSSQTGDADDTPDHCDDESAMKQAFEEVEEDFQALREVDPPEEFPEFDRFFEKHLESFADLQKRYLSIVRCKPNTWATAAAFRYGHGFEVIAEFVEDMPNPFPEDIDEHESYATSVENMVTPLEAETERIFEDIVQWADRNNLDNEWVDRARERTDNH